MDSPKENKAKQPVFERPTHLTGYTDNVKLNLPTGERRSFYITINKVNNYPVEIFISSGKSGEEANADSEALGRLASIALQYGVPAEVIIKSLQNTNGGMYGTYLNKTVTSKADLIAVALTDALETTTKG
jgi:ribonucleoside-diphosphate reductase alpha chain